MQKLCLFILACAATLLLGADNKTDESKVDAEKLQGTWQCKDLNISGESTPVDRIGQMRMKFGDNWMSIYHGDTFATTAKFKLDASQQPKVFDIEEDKVQLGIYELSDNTLKLCIAEKRESGRPKEVRAGSGVIYFVFKREAEKKDK